MDVDNMRRGYFIVALLFAFVCMMGWRDIKNNSFDDNKISGFDKFANMYCKYKI